jgi:hypothetical protein
MLLQRPRAVLLGLDAWLADAREDWAVHGWRAKLPEMPPACAGLFGQDQLVLPRQAQQIGLTSVAYLHDRTLPKQFA